MRPFRLIAVLAATLVLAGACGNDTGDTATGAGTATGTGTATGSVTIASFDFPESNILAYVYGHALEDAGVEVTYKLGLGSREVVAPALAAGEVDLVPEYVGNILAFYDADAAQPGDDLEAVTTKLREAAPEELAVLDPSPAADGDVIAVTQETAEQLDLSSIEDLEGHAGELVFGGPPECPERVTCLKGLQDVYGLEFAEFRPLDVGGPVTFGALAQGDVDVARVFSSDPRIKSQNLVVLDDPRSVQPPGNVVPVVRVEVLTDEIRRVLNEVSAALTTDDLIDMNASVGVDKEDPEDVAEAWLRAEGLIS